MEYTGSIGENLKPTFQNVTKEFITHTMYRLQYSKEIPNFKMRFCQNEAMDFIKKVLQEYSTYGRFSERKSQEILKELDQGGEQAEKVYVMVIKDYQDFFEQLRQFYEEHIRLFFKRTGLSSFHSYAMVNCFELIWLRMTPEDFSNPEAFLRKQTQMLRDNTFEKYDRESCLGKVPCLGDNILCIQNKVSRIWDESSQELQITIYDKDYFYSNDSRREHSYELPAVRYGVFEKEGKKVCSITSIQNKQNEFGQNNLHKKVDRAKYKANKGATEEETDKVEPKNLIALSIFVNVLHQEGITEIEIPSMYALDYEYHIKRSKKLMREFKDKWYDDSVIGNYKDIYIREKGYLERTYGKEDLISELKSERFIKTFDRLSQTYQNSEVRSYSSELDSYYHISIPRVRKKEEIKNEMLQQLYSVVERAYEDIEI